MGFHETPVRWSGVLVVGIVSVLGTAPALAQEQPNAVAVPPTPTLGGPREISLETAEQALRAARQHQDAGRFLEARDQYLRITRAPLPEDAREARKVIHAAARAELEELDTKLAYVSVVVQGTTTAPITVVRDNEQLPATSLGVPLPLLPGKHRFQASTAELRSMPVVVTLEPGGVDTVVLTLGTLADDHPGAAPSTLASDREWRFAASSSGPEAPGATSLPSDRPLSERPLMIGALGALGVGVVGVSLGSYFFLSNPSSEEADRLFESCSRRPNPCSAAERETINDLDSAAQSRQSAWGWGSMLVGVSGLATSGVLYVMDRNQDASRRAARVTPVVGASYLGVAGTF
jgi:hypothetical protein